MSKKICLIFIGVGTSIVAMEQPGMERIEVDRSLSDSALHQPNGLRTNSSPAINRLESASSSENKKSKKWPFTGILASVKISKLNSKNDMTLAQKSPERAAAENIYNEHKEKLISTSSSDVKKSRSKELTRSKKEVKRDEEKKKAIAEFMERNPSSCKEVSSVRSSGSEKNLNKIS